MNDIDSSLTYTNDSILTHILLFGQASSDIPANTLILNNATRKYIISTKRFQESIFLVFCNFLLYFDLFLRIFIMTFFLRLYIHIHLVLRFVFIYL